MPVNVVHSQKDEQRWDAAKRRAKQEGHSGDWKYVMGIYEKMSGTKKAVEHRDKESEYGADETYAWPDKHSYPLTVNGKPSRERVLAAWRYANKEHNAAPPAVRSRIKRFAKEHFDLDLEGHMKGRLALAVAPAPHKPEDDMIGPEGMIRPSAQVRLSLRSNKTYIGGSKLVPAQRSIMQQHIDNRPYVRVRFDCGGKRYSLTVAVDEHDRPAGKVTMREDGGRQLFETNREFGTVADIVEYCCAFIESLGPAPVYPKDKGAIVGEQEGYAADAEIQINRLNANDRTALYLHTGR